MKRLMQHLGGLVLTVALGGLCAATLVRIAPGFGIDERELDARLSDSSRAAIRASYAAESNVFRYYAGYMAALVRGDLGVSHSLRRPVSELIRDRGPVTARLAGFGLLAGWAIALALAALCWRIPVLDAACASFAGVLLCLPAALVGLFALFTRTGAEWAIALIVMPKIFSYARGLFAKVSGQAHVVLARAKGLGPGRILLRHILPNAAPELLALAGVSVSLAFGAAIPIEAVCDIPGIGQLAWQAALGRDLPVLVVLTLILTLATRVANAAADLAGAAA
jgi:peptide/nickel transport system permease protein